MAKQAKIAFLTWSTVSKVAFVIEPWRVPSSFFGNISSVIFLSENAFLRNIRKQAKKKKEGKKSLEDLAASDRQLHSQGALPNYQRVVSDDCKLQLFEPETVLDIQRKENWVASSLFFFRRKQARMLGKKGSKSDGELHRKHWFCIRGNISARPHQPPARLSGTRSIDSGLLWEVTNAYVRLSYSNLPSLLSFSVSTGQGGSVILSTCRLADSRQSKSVRDHHRIKVRKCSESDSWKWTF